MNETVSVPKAKLHDTMDRLDRIVRNLSSCETSSNLRLDLLPFLM